MARDKTSSGTSSDNKSGSSTTKPTSEGTPIKLEVGGNRSYLCAHICAASKKPRTGNKGQNLYQRTVTIAIQAEAELNHGVWSYLAEVGYNMRTVPPSALMSDREGRRHQPSSFPLGAAKREIENMDKGAFRIPDVTILKVTAAEIIQMRKAGVIDWKRFEPIDANIENLVEIKFGNDTWGNKQFEDYNTICPTKVREIADKDCSCSTRKPPKGGTAPVTYPAIKNPDPYKNATFRPAAVGLTPQRGIPSMLGAFGKMISPPSQKVIFYRKYVPLKEYNSMMIPITAGIGLASAFICGSVIIAGGAAAGGAATGGVAAGAAVGGSLMITGFATLATS